jgi:glucose-6-phosphate isomerase
MLPAVNPTKTEAWGELKALYKATKNDTMREAFQKDPMRAQKYSLIWNEILLDYSKNRINDQIIDALFRLAEQTGVFEAIEMMFEGSAINATENRPVLHTALRRPETDKLLVKGRDIMPDIHSVLKRMRTFAHNVRHGVHTGYTGKPIRHVVNIGIGGSDLGPKMVVEALKPYQKEGLSIYFVSNVDPSHIYEVFKVIDPETTLFLIASKTFTTQETMLNAHAAKDWHIRHAREHQRIDLHFAAMSTNLKGVEAFGINTKNCFEFWDFVGGRFSLWSAIGLPIMMSVGTRLFDELLEGAHAMDRHFATEKKGEYSAYDGLIGYMVSKLLWSRYPCGSPLFAIPE